MTTLGTLVKGYGLSIAPLPPFDPAHVMLEVAAAVGRANMTASINGPGASPAAPVDLGAPAALLASIVAWTYQDDDAHEDCSLTACLNPLHPGPCKGWKGTLHSVSPGAWHAIEAARVEKANANRIKKIEALKAQGKPIPHKLLQPILPKPNPQAGQTANKATGEAHAAGQAVSDAAGVKTSTPGKITLGQAVKTLAAPKPVEKGPKGKKPTLGSKGIAFVIAQEKVTPQYKLDKAAAITPEQWAGLSEADQATIRGELSKIKIDGFGPQQKKADELLTKLAPGAQPKPGELKPGTPGTITTPSGKTYQKVSLKDLQQTKPAAPEVAKVLEKAKAEPPKITEMVEPNNPTSAGQAATTKTVAEAIFGKQNTPMATMVDAFDKMKAKGKPVQEHPGFKGLVNNLAQAALKKATADKMPGLGHGDNDAHIGTFNKEIADHLAEGKPGLPPLVAKMVAHHEASKPENVKTAIEKAAKDAAAAKVVAKHEVAGPPKVVPMATPVQKPVQTPKHVTDAIAMATGTAPGASWSKNHLAAYQKLSGDDFKSLPPDVQKKVIAELGKAETKFLDPKKITAAKALKEKFQGGAPVAPKGPEKSKVGISFAQGLKDHDLSETQAKRMAAAAPKKGLFLAAKDSAGLTELDSPDNGEHAMAASDDADALVKVKTKLYSHSVTSQAEVIAAIDKLHTAATKQSYATALADAKSKAYNKISLKLATSSSDLTPLQKASLVEYQKYLLAHNKPETGTADIDKLKADTKAAENELTDKLHAALKKANAPQPDEMSNAQIADRTVELLGDIAADVKTNLSLGEIQYQEKMGKAKADALAKAEGYPPEVLADPSVAAKLAALGGVNAQINVSKAQLAKFADHIKHVHSSAINDGVDKNGNTLTANDKKIIAKHAALLKTSHSHIDDTLAHNEAKLPVAEAAFHDAAKKAQEKLKPVEPVTVSQFDQDTIGEVYRGAWGTVASKAVVYGAKTYGTKTKMSEHAQYPSLKADMIDLQQLAGKLAVATAQAHAAKLDVPVAESGGMEDGPEKAAWLAATVTRNDLQKQFDTLHKTAQARLDTIRASVGLKNRALPKLNSPAVKTQAAESAYYKTGGYGKPLYGKPASAKQYLVAKVGPELAVPHKSASDKAYEKAEKASAEIAKAKAAMPPPKVHAKPPSTEKGKGPNADSATMLGYHFTPKVAEGDQHGWPTADNGAYVSSPEGLAELKKHLGNEDTKYGLAAQKEFKWSIGNMESKGAATSGKNALHSYTGSSYGTINTKLNGLPPGVKKTGSPQISSIDAVFAASPPLEGDVVLYRGFSSPETVFKSGKWNDVNVAGVEWSQRSYSSTSGALSTAQSFAGPGGVVMRIIIPKEMGIKGINAKGGQHPGENEIILERGIRYRVVADYGKSGSDNRRYVDVMVVPSPYDKPE